MGRHDRDYYEILGIDKSADERVLKRAFRARARELHPDVSADPQAEELFSQLAEAYEVLSTPRRRLLYDQFGYRGWGRGGTDGGTVVNFEQEAAARRGRTPQAIVELELDSVAAARGGVHEVPVVVPAECATCSGQGAAPATRSTVCSSCGGTGRHRHRLSSAAGQLLQLESCEQCSGEGLVYAEPCRECHGSGKTRSERKLEVEVPRGANNGDRIAPIAPGDPVVVLSVIQLPDWPFIRHAAAAGFVIALAGLVLAVLLL